jgi:hypothetical protein
MVRKSNPKYFLSLQYRITTLTEKLSMRDERR